MTWLDTLWLLTEIESRVDTLSLIADKLVDPEQRARTVRKLRLIADTMEAGNGGLLQSLQSRVPADEGRSAVPMALYIQPTDTAAELRLRGSAGLAAVAPVQVDKPERVLR